MNTPDQVNENVESLAEISSPDFDNSDVGPDSLERKLSQLNRESISSIQ